MVAQAEVGCAEPSHGVVLFYASKSRGDLMNFMQEKAQLATSWISDIGMTAPVNRLDNLVMNRHKFTVFGDRTWDRLFEKYEIDHKKISSLVGWLA